MLFVLYKQTKNLIFQESNEYRKCEQWKTELAGLTDSDLLPSFSFFLSLFFFILYIQTIDPKEKVGQLILVSSMKSGIESATLSTIPHVNMYSKEYLKFMVLGIIVKKKITYKSTSPPSPFS